MASPPPPPPPPAAVGASTSDYAASRDDVASTGEDNDGQADSLWSSMFSFSSDSVRLGRFAGSSTKKIRSWTPDPEKKSAFTPLRIDPSLDYTYDSLLNKSGEKKKAFEKAELVSSQSFAMASAGAAASVNARWMTEACKKRIIELREVDEESEDADFLSDMVGTLEDGIISPLLDQREILADVASHSIVDQRAALEDAAPAAIKRIVHSMPPGDGYLFGNKDADRLERAINQHAIFDARKPVARSEASSSSSSYASKKPYNRYPRHSLYDKSKKGKAGSRSSRGGKGGKAGQKKD